MSVYLMIVLAGMQIGTVDVGTAPMHNMAECHAKAAEAQAADYRVISAICVVNK